MALSLTKRLVKGTALTASEFDGNMAAIEAAVNGGPGVAVQDEGGGLGVASTVNFAGAGVTAAIASGTVTVTIPGGGGGSGVAVQDETSPLGTATTVNFAGAGVTATLAGGVSTVTIPGGTGVPYLTPTAVKTANYTSSPNEMVLTDTTAGSFTVTLPTTPSNGDRVVLIDSSGTGAWGVNALSVARNGKTINGAAQNLVLSSNTSTMLVYSSATGDWRADVDPFVNLRDFGAVGNGILLAGAGSISSTASTTTLTVTGAQFVSTDVGKLISVAGAGAAGVDLKTTISSVTSATVVVLAAAAGTTVAGAEVTYGTNDTTSVQAAANSGKQVICPAGRYMCNSQITLNAKTCLIGAGEAFTFFDFRASTGTISNACLFVSGTTSALPALSGTHAKGVSTVTFASAHGLQEGDLFTITVQTTGSYLPGSGGEWRRGEWCEVRKVTSTTVVETIGGLFDTYTAAEATNTKIIPASTVMESLTVRGSRNVLVPALRLDLQNRARLRNVTAVGSRDSGIMIEGNYGTRITNCSGIKASDDLGDGESYGFAIGGSQDIILMACDGFGDRHGCTIGGAHNLAVQLVNRLVLIIASRFNSDINNSADIHPIAEHCGYFSCEILNGLDIGGDYNRVEDCIISSKAGNKLIDLASSKGPNHVFKNNTLKPLGIPTATYAWADFGSSGTGIDANTTRDGTLLVDGLRFELPRADVLAGTTQAGGSTTTIQLATTASAVDSTYVGFPIRITKGTNVGYVGWITAYVGATKVATLSAAAPAAFTNTTTNYEIALSTLAGQLLVQASQNNSPAQVNFVLKNVSVNDWAPCKSNSAIVINVNNSKQWGDVTLENVKVNGGIRVGDVENLEMTNVVVWGNEFDYGFDLNNVFGKLLLNRVEGHWIKTRAFIFFGPATSRVHGRGLLFDQCCQDGSEVFTVSNAAYVNVDVVVRRNRGGGRDVDMGLASTGTVTEACVSGQWATFGATAATQYYSPQAGGAKVTWGTAAPTVGTWTTSDAAIRQPAAIGSPKGWRCTTAGTPGTWTSEGNL